METDLAPHSALRQRELTHSVRHVVQCTARLGVLLALAACGDEGATSDDGTVNCATDPRVDTYTANMVKESAGGMQVTLISSDPAPPAKGNNSWRIGVTDPAGVPVVDAPIDVQPFMPDHGHGTSVRPMTTADTDGTYDVVPLNLFMPGVWRVSLEDLNGPSGGDFVEFFFCIEG